MRSEDNFPDGVRDMRHGVMREGYAGFPRDWDEARVQRLLALYEEQSEEEAVAEDEAAFADQTQAVMEIPLELVPVVRALLAEHYGDNKIPA